ncbi:hypothetical protein HHO41_12955 [Bacillus sp. DNRA2]|uniref:hypothetical protein n=1 Tax=Bacillus sp. DNRA2 TaxID=2723053 RepID=UPI00145C5DA4|nr:hypothetical protein [Bacillus sp. DNRA2]NMD71209.1 hypothetical protein [Bacillus sp. DNRA2]
MFKKVIGIIIVFQLICTIASAQTNRQIEIFDISKGKVIRNVQSKPEIQEEVKEFLEGITGVYVKYNPIPNEGFMIRIPIDRPVMVKNKWFNDLVDEVTIIFSGQENPYLMVFDDENRMHIFTFEGDTAKLLKLLNFRPDSLG